MLVSTPARAALTSRLTLSVSNSTRVGLASALAILGVSAPEVMERLDADDAGPAAPDA